MSSLLEKVGQAQFSFKDESFCVNGPMNKKREQLMIELLNAQRTAENKDKGGDQRINLSPVKVVTDKIAALEDKMREFLITIRFTAVNNGEWQKWILQNPPRKGNAMDQNLGYNAEKFFWRAATESAQYVEDPGTEDLEWTDAVLAPISPAEWEELNKVLTAGDWDRIDMTLIALNQREGQRGADFLRTGSRTMDDSEPISDSLATSE